MEVKDRGGGTRGENRNEGEVKEEEDNKVRTQKTGTKVSEEVSA